MQLEQIMYQPMQRTLSTEGRNYNSVDLEYLSASVLYCGSPLSFGSKPLGLPSFRSAPLPRSEPLKPIPELKFFREEWRFDEHEPYGSHLNVETWLDLQGSKEGRSIKLSNTHIPLMLAPVFNLEASINEKFLKFLEMFPPIK